MDRFEHFTVSVFRITHYWNKIATEEMKRHGMKGSYALYLVILAGNQEGTTASRLAELTQRDKADVSRAVSLFQQNGIVEPYGNNRYRAPIILTEEGRRLAGRIRLKADQALQAAGKGLSEEGRRNMYQALDLIADNLKGICDSEEFFS